MSYVEDRWQKTVPGPDGKPVKVRTELWGKGLRYRARYTDSAGKERAKSFPDGFKEEAKTYAAAAQIDVQRGTWIDPKVKKVTLREFTEKTWLPMQGGAPSTRERLAAHLNGHILPRLGARELDDLARHPSVIQAWVNSLPLAAATAQGALGVLSAILSAAVADNLIAANPCRATSVKAPRQPDKKVIPWDTPTLAAVRAELEGRYRAITDCGSGLGLRQGEIFGLSPVGDIDWLRGTVHVTRQLRTVQGHLVLSPPKGGKERDVPLPRSTSLALAAHLQEYPAVPVALPWLEPGGKLVTVPLIFTTPRLRGIRATYFDRLDWKPAVIRAGRPGTRADGMHILRHTFASVLLRAGIDIKTLAEYLGHSDASFTLRTYCHLMPGGDEKMRDAIDAQAGSDWSRPGFRGEEGTARSGPC